MKREEIIRNLEYTMEKHKNNTVDTFDTNISLMCKDILDYLERDPCEDIKIEIINYCTEPITGIQSKNIPLKVVMDIINKYERK